MKSKTGERQKGATRGVLKTSATPYPGTFNARFGRGIDNIVSYWLTREEGSFERWDADTRTLVVSAASRTIRCRMRAVGPVNTDPFEVVIGERGGHWYLKADCWDEPETEYPLRMFVGESATIFICSDENDQLYFHLYTTG